MSATRTRAAALLVGVVVLATACAGSTETADNNSDAQSQAVTQATAVADTEALQPDVEGAGEDSQDDVVDSSDLVTEPTSAPQVAVGANGTTPTNEAETDATAPETRVESEPTVGADTAPAATPVPSTPAPPTPTAAPAVVVPGLQGQFQTINGAQIDLGSLQGQDVVLWFWAPW